MQTDVRATGRTLAGTIRQAIGSAPNRMISFAEYMGLALYAPGQGYYRVPEAARRTGPYGDFDTAPEIHPIYGALVARQLAQMWLSLGRPAEFAVVEVGAGSGALARSIITSAPALGGGFAEALRYTIVEPYEPLRRAQQAPAGTSIRWVASLAELEPVTGCILANELLDAFPVHRLQRQDGAVQEIYITLADDDPGENTATGFTLPESIDEWLPDMSGDGVIEGPALRLREVLAPVSTPALNEYGAALEKGERIAVNLAAQQWVAEAAAMLRQGYLLLVDYGYRDYEEHRAKKRDVASDGLRCYYRHTLQHDPYIRAGKQDITAPVDFGAIQQAGHTAGLHTTCLVTQREWLSSLGIEAVLAGLDRHDPGYYQERFALQELVRPGGMGSFWVLMQAR